MKIQIEFINFEQNKESLHLIKKVLKKAEKECCKKNKCGVFVGICGNEYIKKVNAEQRKIDKATDVLSFPMIEWEKPCGWDTIKIENEISPESGRVELGDILISLEKAKEQSEEYGHSTQREIAYLALHGFLHLMGYDHMEETDRKIMREQEEKIMGLLGIGR
ncbi:MAG: rRNA maturation RNase YbeY [Clostridia bacterium]|nr:rRNA maturation RNase YbeY [Clostridia bacterium]